MTIISAPQGQRSHRAQGDPEACAQKCADPILTVIGLTAAVLISGAVVTETIFSLPGIGNLVVSAVLRRDYPVIQGALLVIAGLYVLINFAIDMLYLLVDPRVRY